MLRPAAFIVMALMSSVQAATAPTVTQRLSGRWCYHGGSQMMDIKAVGDTQVYVNRSNFGGGRRASNSSRRSGQETVQVLNIEPDKFRWLSQGRATDYRWMGIGNGPDGRFTSFEAVASPISSGPVISPWIACDR
jgi:hypothetical protein